MTLRTRLALWFLPISLVLVLIPWWLTRPQNALRVSSLPSEPTGTALSAPSSQSERDPATNPAADRATKSSTPTAAQPAPQERRAAQSNAPVQSAPAPVTPAPVTPTTPAPAVSAREAPPALVDPVPETPAAKPSAEARASNSGAEAPSSTASGAATADVTVSAREAALEQQLEALQNRSQPVLLRLQNGQLEVLDSPATATTGSSPAWWWAGALLVGAWLAGAWGIRRSLAPLYTLAAEIARRGPTRLDALEAPPLPELRPAVTALNHLLEELREKLTRLELQEQSAKRFAYNASHELRNPLTAARNYLEVLERHPNEGAAGLQALEAIRRTEKVLGSLLTLARLEGRGRVRGEGVDVRSFLEANFELPVEGDATIWAERDLLELAIENIVKNADEHAGGIRRARIESTPAGVWLWFEDDGPGFAAEIMGRAFEPFVHGGSSKGGSSTGLGLAIVEAVVRAHAGEVRAENRVLNGAVVGARVGLRLPSATA